MKLWRPRPVQPDLAARKPATGPERKRVVEENIPIGVEIAGALAWRILVIVAVLVVFGLLVVSLREIVVPFLIAMLIAALLAPFKSFLVRHRWPKWLAVVLALLVGVVVIGGLVFVIVTQVRVHLSDIERQSLAAYASFKDYVSGPPFNVTKAQYSDYVDQVVAAIKHGSGTVVLTTGRLFTGALLTIFTTVFIVIDGSRIWAFLVRLFPRRARAATDGAGRAGWVTLTAFIRVQSVVAAIDGIVIGLVAYFLGLPLAIPIGIFVFLGSYIPIVGAIVTGAFAVAIALVYLGPITAVWMLVGVLGVHILEGNLLHPFITGTAVKVHPLAVVLAVAAGSFVAGIPGALFAVPLVAVANVMISYIARGSWKTNPRPQVRDVVSSDE
jgi:predicted PurR-regulated permease PerM